MFFCPSLDKFLLVSLLLLILTNFSGFLTKFEKNDYVDVALVNNALESTLMGCIGIYTE